VGSLEIRFTGTGAETDLTCLSFEFGALLSCRAFIQSGKGCDFKKSHRLISGFFACSPQAFRGFTTAMGADFSGHFVISLQQHWADMHTSTPFLLIVSFVCIVYNSVAGLKP